MEIIKNIIKCILNLSIEQITLISIIVTFIIYLLGRRNELKFKKHELKKDKYMEFINIFKDTYLNGGHLELTDELKERFFNFGSTMFIYGSKKMYKKYCFFKEANTDLVKKTKFYDKNIVTFLMADMLNQIRKEIGLNEFEFPLNYKSIAFFTNDIYFSPTLNLKWWDYKLRVFLIKFELFLLKIIKLEFLKIIFKFICLPFKILSLLGKYFIMIPIGKIISKFINKKKD